MSIKLLAIPGSLRKGSLNRKLLRIAVREATALGATVDEVDLKTLAFPIYDGDLEAEITQPEPGKVLREKIAAADGILLVTPEYNHGIPGGLKNAIDWASRPPNQPFKGKVAGLMSASPGAFGGVRSLMAVRASLTTLGVWLLPSQVTLAHADKQFDEKEELKDPRVMKELQAVVATLIDECKRRKG